MVEKLLWNLNWNWRKSIIDIEKINISWIVECFVFVLKFEWWIYVNVCGSSRSLKMSKLNEDLKGFFIEIYGKFLLKKVE